MKKILLLLSIIYLTINGYSQPGYSWQWARDGINRGTGSYTEGQNLTSDIHGNVYLTGYYIDTLTFGPYSFYGDPLDSSFTYYIVKYNSVGNLIWAKSSSPFGSLAYTNIGIAADTFGNVFITGIFRSHTITFDSITLTNANIGGIFLVKYDSAGNVLWAKTQDAGDARATAVSTDDNGNSYVTGSFSSSSVTFGTQTINSYQGYPGIFLVKYDPMGNAIWAKGACGDNQDQASGVATDKFGNVYVHGFMLGPVIHFGTDSLINTYNNRIIILIKYDTAGNFIWVKSSDGYSSPVSYGVATDRQGNIFITGYYSFTALTFGPDTLDFDNVFNPYCGCSYPNVYIVKYDSSGSLIWTKSNIGIAYSICTDTLGDAYISGLMPDTIISFDTITFTPIFYSDNMYFVEFNPSGHGIVGYELIGGGDDNNAISVTPAGSIYVGGDFGTYIPFILGNDTLIATAIESPFVAQFGPCLPDFPVNSFIVDTLSGCKPLTVHFTNKSTNATSYIWHFGDGGTSTLTNPSHLYGNSGNYTITLIAYDSSACGVFTDTSSQTFYFTVFIPPIAPTITQHGDTLISSYNSGNQWYLFTNAISGATDSIYIVNHTGCYHVNETDSNGCEGKSDTVCFSFAGIKDIGNSYGVSIFPNPNDGMFTLSYSFPSSGISNYEFGIMDVLGRTVYSQSITNQYQTTINISQLSNGVCFYQLTNNQETYRGKFVKTN